MCCSFSKQIITATILISSIVLTACGDSGSSGAANESPVAVDDNYSVNEGGTLVIDNSVFNSILTNDSDIDNDTLTAILVANVSVGILALNPDGTLIYTHNGSENTGDSFTYQASDGTNSNVATVTFNIDPVNDAPVANGDFYSLGEGGTLTIASVNGVLANDSDPENDTLTASLVNNVSFGVLALNSDGSFSYTHNGSENLNDSFSYKAFDGQLNSSTVTVSISVSAVNEAPVAIIDAYSGVNEGGTLTVTSVNGLLANDSDPENNALTAILVASPSFASSFFLNNDGTFSYTHNGSENLNDSFSYKAFDGQLNSNTVTVSISVSAVNEAPVANIDAYNGVNEAGTLTVTSVNGVLANDSDPENDTLTAVLVSNVSFGVLALNSNGSFSYTHDGSENLNDSFSYRTFDGQLNSSTVTVSINVSAVNEAPVANIDAYNGVNEAGTLTVTSVNGLLANDSDPENDTLTAVLVNNVSYGVLALNSNGSFSYTHNGSENLNDSFSYRAFDGQLNSSAVTVSVSVSAINDVPVANDDSYSTNGATVLNITNTVDGVLSNDQDPDSSLTATVVTGPSFASGFILNADGTFSYAHNGSTNYIDSFTYQANDGSNASNTATVTINVSINQLPVAISSCSTTAQASAKNGTLNATDADNLLLTFSLGSDGLAGSGPMDTARGSVEITDPTTGAYTYTPSATGPRGTDSFDFFVEDPDGGFATATETVIVDQKIMPLGDSITRGTESTSPSLPAEELRVGYRKPLYDSLIAAGYSFDYVGSDALAGSAVADFDSDNEGHSGWTASEIAFGRTATDGIGVWLDDNPTDIILLHIGTNNGPVPGTEFDAESILDEIDAWEISSNGNPVTVILAKIVDQNPQNPDVTAYNIALGIMALARATDDIIIVDMETALSYPADLGDSVHPNAGGYAKMAPVWHDGLVPVLDKCP